MSTRKVPRSPKTGARRARPRASARALRPPKTSDVIEAILEISKQISFEMTEETLLGRYATALTRLFLSVALFFEIRTIASFGGCEETSEGFGELLICGFSGEDLNKSFITDAKEYESIEGRALY